MIHHEELALGHYLASNPEPWLQKVSKFGLEEMPADYKCCCSKENLENWKEKPLHRQFLCDAVDSEFSMEMAFNKQSQKETEGFIFACQKQAIPTNLIKVRIFQQPGSIYCHLCGSQQETIDHLLTSCSVIAHHLLLASKPPLLASSQ